MSLMLVLLSEVKQGVPMDQIALRSLENHLGGVTIYRNGIATKTRHSMRLSNEPCTARDSKRLTDEGCPKGL